MKQGKIINAYRTLEALSKKNELPGKTARALFDLRKALRPTMEFFEEERVKLVNSLGAVDEESGMLSVAKENLPQFNEKLNALLNLDVDIPGLPVDIFWPNDVAILPEHLWELDGFANFVFTE